MSGRNIRRSTVLAAVSFAALALSSGMAQAQEISSAPAAITSSPQQSAGTLIQLSDAEFVLQPSAGVSAVVTGTGATLTDGAASEALPTSATDKTGAAVSIRYVQVADGVHIQVIDPNKTVAEPDTGTAHPEGFFQCALGTIGGGGGGGLAGAGVGSVLPGLGTAAGGIIGGISGAASGAAASCF